MIKTPDNFLICSKTTSLQYLRKYWTKALSVINRLEKQWQFSFQEQPILTNSLFYTKIKNILGCYEILIVQFNQYCEVLEIQGLGKCMLKIFIQIISILNILLKKMVAIDLLPNNKNPKQSKSHNQDIKYSKKNQISTKNYYWAQKQKNKYQMKEAQQQLKRIQQNYESSNNMYNLQNAKKSLEKAVSLESSEAQFIIREAFLLLEAKQSSLKTYLSFRNQNLKNQESTHLKKDYDFFHKQLEESINKRESSAKLKLLQIFKKYLNLQEIEKKKRMISVEIQTVVKPTVPNLQTRKQIQKLKQQLQHKTKQIKHTKQQMLIEKQKSQKIEIHLSQKVKFYESQLMKYKLNIINLQQRISIVSKLSQNSKTNSQQEENQVNRVTDELISKSNKLANSDKLDLISEFMNIQDRQTQMAIGGSSSNKTRSTVPSNMSSAKSTIKFNIKQKQLYETNLNFHSQAYHYDYLPELQFNVIPYNCQTIKTTYNSSQNSTEDQSTQTQAQILSIMKDQNQSYKKIKSRKQIIAQNDECLNKQNVNLNNQINQNKIEHNFSIYRAFDFDFLPLKQVNTKRAKIVSFDVNKGINNSGNENLRKKKMSVNWPKSSFYSKMSRNMYSIQQSQQKNYENNNNQYQKYKFTAQNKDSFSQNFAFINFSKILNKNEQKQVNKYEIRRKIPDLDNLIFTHHDIDNMVLKAQTAISYQLLNSKQDSFKNKFSSIENLKSQKPMRRSYEKMRSKSRKKRYLSFCQTQPAKPNFVTIQILIKQLYNHLKNLKQESLKKYQKICDFLKFPYTVIFKSGKELRQKSNACIALGMGFFHLQHQLDICELRKIGYRLKKIHCDCDKIKGLEICQHLVDFFGKIGITFQQRN